MQNRNYKIIINILVVVCLPLLKLNAQKSQGEVKTDDIEIYKDTKVSLPQANRIFEKIPMNVGDDSRKPIRYEFV